MKYGETLRQRSIPAWSHYNIDYDDIKLFIKERTTPRNGPVGPIAISAGPDSSLIETEDALFSILHDQHDRIDLFVRSKNGEISRRLDHARRQLRQLSLRRQSTFDRRTPVVRLSRCSKLETDVLKAGDELRSLARFTAAQRTGFRKLLKKYKKWSGSTRLESRVRDEILNDPKSFTQLDFTSMLDGYSDVLHDIRRLCAADFPRDSRRGSVASSDLPTASPPTTVRLESAISNGSKVAFDVALDTIPLGSTGSLASYFVHPENIIELQVYLLRHFEHYCGLKCGSASLASPASPSSRPNAISPPTRPHDCFLIAADNADRFAQQQASITVGDTEHMPGIMPQRARLCVRWTPEDDAVLSSRVGAARATLATFKAKHIASFFDRRSDLSGRRSSICGDVIEAGLDDIRSEALKDSTVRPLYQISSCRSRYTGINNSDEHFIMASLDTDIKMDKHDGAHSFNLPFALLQIRQEGLALSNFMNTLDQSHLVERVRGFSLQFHALWQVCSPQSLAPPFWASILWRDIRKLPPPAVPSDSGSTSTAYTPEQLASMPDNGDAAESSTAVETAATSITLNNTADRAVSSSPRAPRKKRVRTYTGATVIAPQQRYWSEYNHPEHEDGEGGYVIYIDPNERTSMEKFFDKLADLFRSEKPRKLEEDLDTCVPGSPQDEDESSSDEEDTRKTLLSRIRHTSSARQASTTYGTLSTVVPTNNASVARRNSTLFAPPQHLTVPCLLSSLAILIVASFLSATHRRKLAREADAAIIFAICCSLVLALVGSASLLRHRGKGLMAYVAAGAILLIDAICSGVLIAGMIG